MLLSRRNIDLELHSTRIKLEAVRHLIGSFGSGMVVYLSAMVLDAGQMPSTIIGILAALPGWATLDLLVFQLINKIKNKF